MIYPECGKGSVGELLDAQWFRLTSGGGWYPYRYGLIYLNRSEGNLEKDFLDRKIS
jgi:hypothetical protein